MLHPKATTATAHRSTALRRSLLGCALMLAGWVSTPAWAAEEAPAETCQADSTQMANKRLAQTTAIGDSLSTGLGIASGAVEVNPLIGTTPLGLVALAGMKLLMLDQIEQYPEERRVPLQRQMSSLWGGITANNLLLAAGATGVLAIPAGILAGYWIYHSEGFEKAQAEVLAKNQQALQVKPEYVVITELTARPAGANGSYDPTAIPTQLDVRTVSPLPSPIHTYIHPDGTKYFVETHRLKTEEAVTGI